MFRAFVTLVYICGGKSKAGMKVIFHRKIGKYYFINLSKKEVESWSMRLSAFNRIGFAKAVKS